MHKIDVSELKGPLVELFDQLSGEAGRGRFEEFKLWQKGVTSNLLQPVTVVSVSEVRRFIAKERLQAANVGLTGENFKHLFLDKVEENVPAGRITFSTLLNRSLDPEIMVALGKDRRVISLAHLFQLLEKQANGQSGPLLTDGFSNVGYIPDNDGEVRAVDVYRFSYSHFWCVVARPVSDSLGWGAGSRFLSQAA